MAFTQFATASRFSEVSALRWEDVDEQRGIVRIRRGNWRTGVSTAKIDRRRRNPALTDELRQVLGEWRDGSIAPTATPTAGGCFRRRGGSRTTTHRGWGKAFEACLKEIGVDRRFSSHGLRRTANDLIRRVASGEVARAITGHVTERMTEHYSHVDVGEKRAAMEGVLRLVQMKPVGPANSTTEYGQVGPKQALN